jgi:hypothetical protein
MHLPVPRPIAIPVVLMLVLAACSGDNAAPRSDPPSADGAVLTSFDRLSLAPGDEAGFKASVMGPSARLSSAGLVFTSRAPAIARVTADGGRARVRGLAAGRTYVLVRSAAGADSVEVVVR